MANFFGKEDPAMRTLAKVEDFDPHDLRRTASTWANATCPIPWFERLLDHDIWGVAGTYNLYAYVEHKTYVAYAIENKVREALGMRPIKMPLRPLACVRRQALTGASRTWKLEADFMRQRALAVVLAVLLAGAIPRAADFADDATRLTALAKVWGC